MEKVLLLWCKKLVREKRKSYFIQLAAPRKILYYLPNNFYRKLIKGKYRHSNIILVVPPNKQFSFQLPPI